MTVSAHPRPRLIGVKSFCQLLTEPHQLDILTAQSWLVEGQMQFGQIKRRQFITLLGGAAAPMLLPRGAQAQQLPKNWRIGITTIQPRTSPPYAAFDQRLRELGYVEGQNLSLDFLNPDIHPQGIGGAMKELVRRKADVIITPYESALKSALAATDTVPIVMIAIDYDPLALGYINSLARPSGNVTGLFLQQIELATKRLQLLKDALPDLRTATIFWDASSSDQWNATRAAAATLGLRLASIELREQPYDYEQALGQAPPDHRSALIMPTTSVLSRSSAPSRTRPSARNGIDVRLARMG
jgi:ABC-type uncharacterized transport system substrate-binding protein